jgi:hypothetical protein
MSVNEYQLFDPVIFPGGIGTTDPTPDNLGDPDQLLYAVRNFIGQTAVNDGNEVLENLQAGNPYSVGGFNNTNTSGVTSVDVADADLSTSGLEIAIPLERFLGADNFDLFVTIQDGGGSTGVFVPQMLPPTIDAMACTSGMAFALRQDLTNAVTCRAFSVSVLPTYTGVAEGDIDPAEYGLAAPQESQSCPTPYGDQDFDPFLGQISGGSELDALYAANDADNLYLGITGNVELNGNQLIVFIDTDPDDADLGTNGREPDGIGRIPGHQHAGRRWCDWWDAGRCTARGHQQQCGETSTSRSSSTATAGWTSSWTRTISRPSPLRSWARPWSTRPVWRWSTARILTD